MAMRVKEKVTDISDHQEFKRWDGSSACPKTPSAKDNYSVKPPTNVEDIHTARKKKESRTGQEVGDEERYEAWLAAYYFDAPPYRKGKQTRHKQLATWVDNDWDTVGIRCINRQMQSEEHRVRIAHKGPEPVPTLHPRTYHEGIVPDGQERQVAGVWYRPPTIAQLLADAYDHGDRFVPKGEVERNHEISIVEPRLIPPPPPVGQGRLPEESLPPVVREAHGMVEEEPLNEDLSQYATPIPRGDVDYFIEQDMSNHRKYDAPHAYHSDPHILLIRCCHEDETVGEEFIIRHKVIRPKSLKRTVIQTEPQPQGEMQYIEDYFSENYKSFDRKAYTDANAYLAWLQDPDRRRRQLAIGQKVKDETSKYMSALRDMSFYGTHRTVVDSEDRYNLRLENQFLRRKDHNGDQNDEAAYHYWLLRNNNTGHLTPSVSTPKKVQHEVVRIPHMFLKPKPKDKTLFEKLISHEWTQKVVREVMKEPEYHPLVLVDDSIAPWNPDYVEDLPESLETDEQPSIAEVEELIRDFRQREARCLAANAILRIAEASDLMEEINKDCVETESGLYIPKHVIDLSDFIGDPLPKRFAEAANDDDDTPSDDGGDEVKGEADLNYC